MHWRFPAAVQAAIAAHHQPSADSGDVSVADVTHVADAMVHALDLAGDVHEAVPEVDPLAWQRLGLTPDQVLHVLQRTEESVSVLCNALAQ